MSHISYFMMCISFRTFHTSYCMFHVWVWPLLTPPWYLILHISYLIFQFHQFSLGGAARWPLPASHARNRTRRVRTRRNGRGWHVLILYRTVSIEADKMKRYEYISHSVRSNVCISMLFQKWGRLVCFKFGTVQEKTRSLINLSGMSLRIDVAYWI